jgi:hypothetical protein
VPVLPLDSHSVETRRLKYRSADRGKVRYRIVRRLDIVLTLRDECTVAYYLVMRTPVYYHFRQTKIAVSFEHCYIHLT